MITLIIGLGSDVKDFISLHHLLVSMALLTDLRVELPSELNYLRFIALQAGHFVEAMTIRTSG